MKEKITQAVAAVVTFGTMVWSPLGDWVNAAGGQAEIVTAIVAVYTVIHGLIHYGHGKMAGMMLVVFAVLVGGSTPAMAQEPDRGGLLATYSLAHEAPDDGRWGVEADLRVGGTPLLLVGHLRDGEGGIGPKVQHNLGPITLYGHTLFGSFETGMDAMQDSRLRHGAGVEVPVRDGVIVRVGFDRTQQTGGDAINATSVGVGWRF